MTPGLLAALLPASEMSSSFRDDFQVAVFAAARKAQGCGVQHGCVNEDRHDPSCQSPGMGSCIPGWTQLKGHVVEVKRSTNKIPN